MHDRTFFPGEKLFKEGDDPKSLFLIKAGRVTVQSSKKGTEVDLAEIKPNQVVGELSFFDRKPRSASAVALDQVMAIEITFEALEKIYSTVPIYFKAIIASMADRLRQANERIQKLEAKIERQNS